MNLKELTKEAGIVGAGGAGFPLYAKLTSGADTLLINGAECEPLLYTDYFILQRELPMTLLGAEAVLQETGIPRAVLCVKAHTAKRLNFSDGEKLSDKVTVKILPDVYPMGDEISMIYQATGRVVKPGNLPVTAGVVVNNVETLYNAGCAVKLSQSVTMKWLTIGGNIPEPIVLRVPVGTPVSALFRKFSITVPEEHVVLDGGPSMGKIIDPNRAVVTKTTKGLLILPEPCQAVQSKKIDSEMSVARAETACCQCTRCTDMCPRALLGYPLEPHKMVRTAKGAVALSPESVITATLCCGCGVCESLACCQGISPRAVIDYYKGVLAKNGLRYSSQREVSATPEREYRMIPSSRWASVLGVSAFDKLPVFKGEHRDFGRAEINLKQHIGAPSVPVVKDGDIVSCGDKIAESANGLSVPQHASVSGRVTVYENMKIVIDKVKDNA